MQVIVLVPDAKALEDIQNRLCANGAGKFIAEVSSIVIPKNMAQVMLFAEAVKPLMIHLKDYSKVCAGLYEITLNNLPKQ